LGGANADLVFPFLLLGLLSAFLLGFMPAFMHGVFAHTGAGRCLLLPKAAISIIHRTCSPTGTTIEPCALLHCRVPLLQAPALRALSPAEREVLLLLGSDVAASQGQLLIQENDKVRVRNVCVVSHSCFAFINFAICRCYVLLPYNTLVKECCVHIFVSVTLRCITAAHSHL
jgi:hypothetical protein